MARNKKSGKVYEKFDFGSLYQKEVGDTFFFRYQINNSRKTVSLRTKDYNEAKEKVQALLPTIRATSVEVLAAHITEARSLEKPRKILVLGDAWEQYTKQPDRATPATVSEQLSYETSFKEFVNFIDRPVLEIHQVTHEDALAFSQYLKTQEIAVDTHNRKIKRLRKIFNVLKKYCHKTANPFLSSTLLRKKREEQNLGIRRLAFTREQEQELLRVLDDPKRKVMHKEL